MKRIYIFTVGISIVLIFFATAAYGETAPSGELPRNVSIEVEFKEFGKKVARVNILGPYETRRSSEYVKQSLVVSDGMTGTIRVGEDIPYIEYYRRYLFDHGYIETIETTFREIGTKLVVSPKIRGDFIEVSLTPQISYLSKGRTEAINVKELTTQVMVADGQSINIGGLIKDQEFKRYFLKTKEASNLNIILTVRIL